MFNASLNCGYAFALMSWEKGILFYTSCCSIHSKLGVGPDPNGESNLLFKALRGSG